MGADCRYARQVAPRGAACTNRVTQSCRPAQQTIDITGVYGQLSDKRVGYHTRGRGWEEEGSPAVVTLMLKQAPDAPAGSPAGTPRTPAAAPVSVADSDSTGRWRTRPSASPPAREPAVPPRSRARRSRGPCTARPRRPARP